MKEDSMFASKTTKTIIKVTLCISLVFFDISAVLRLSVQKSGEEGSTCSHVQFSSINQF